MHVCLTRLLPSDCEDTARMRNLADYAVTDRRAGCVDKDAVYENLTLTELAMLKYVAVLHGDNDDSPKDIGVVLILPVAGFIEALCIDPEFRGKEISPGVTYASAILTEIMKTVKLPYVWAFSTLSAINFYLRNGLDSEFKGVDDADLVALKSGTAPRSLCRRYCVFNNTVVVWRYLNPNNTSTGMPPIATNMRRIEMRRVNPKFSDDSDDDEVSDSEEDSPLIKRRRRA